jgi:hypothetical protein
MTPRYARPMPPIFLAMVLAMAAPTLMLREDEERPPPREPPPPPPPPRAAGRAHTYREVTLTTSEGLTFGPESVTISTAEEPPRKGAPPPGRRKPSRAARKAGRK